MRENGWMDNYKELMDEVYQDEEIQSFIQAHRSELDEESVAKSSANLYEYLTERKKYEAGERDRVAPGFKPTLVVNKHRIEVNYVATEGYMQQVKEAEIKKRIRSFDMPKNIENVTLSDIDLTAERAEIFDAILTFINGYLEKPNDFHKGLYLYGPYGVGKTYIFAAMAHELARNGMTTTLIHFPSFVVEMKNAINDNSTGDKLNTIKRSEILVIDDIGAESLSSWIRDDILGVILQYRMQEELPTFFTSNFSFDELERHLSVSQKGDWEEVKAARIMERIKFLAQPMQLMGANRRHQ